MHSMTVASFFLFRSSCIGSSLMTILKYKDEIIACVPGLNDTNRMIAYRYFYIKDGFKTN